MGTRILSTDSYNNEEGAVLFDSCNGWAFGPVFESGDMAEAFIQYVSESGRDVKDMSNGDLGYAHAKFLEEWRYCGLSDDERRLYDEYEIEFTAGGDKRNEFFALKIKVEDNRHERWDL